MELRDHRVNSLLNERPVDNCGAWSANGARSKVAEPHALSFGSRRCFQSHAQLILPAQQAAAGLPLPSSVGCLAPRSPLQASHGDPARAATTPHSRRDTLVLTLL